MSVTLYISHGRSRETEVARLRPRLDQDKKQLAKMAGKGKCGPNYELYKKRFKEADVNGDGYLTVQELRGLLKSGGSSMTDSQVAVSECQRAVVMLLLI